MKTEKGLNVVELWMDQTIGKVSVLGKPESILREIFSYYESRERIEGEGGDGIMLGAYRATNDEFTKHNKEKNAMRTFFKSLANALEPYDRVVVSGTGTKPAEFCNFINSEKLLVGTEVVLEKDVS